MPSDKCPKCGADAERSPFRYQRNFRCGSVTVAKECGEWKLVSQSDACRIDELTAANSNLAAELAEAKRREEGLRDIATRLVAECDDTYHDPVESMNAEWRQLYEDAKAALFAPAAEEAQK